MAENFDKLTAKQKAFCEAYVENGYNGTQAYLSAYDTDNYNTAKTEGNKLLKKPHIREYVSALQKEQFAQACITAERVAMKLADIAFAVKGDEDYNTSAQLKALDLLQKQLGIQHQKIEADVSHDIIINIGREKE